VEGWQAKYVTGSGQTAATASRVHIFETEGETHANHRRGRTKTKKSHMIRSNRIHKINNSNRTGHNNHDDSSTDSSVIKPKLSKSRTKKRKSVESVITSDSKRSEQVDVYMHPINASKYLSHLSNSMNGINNSIEALDLTDCGSSYSDDDTSQDSLTISHITQDINPYEEQTSKRIYRGKMDNPSIYVNDISTSSYHSKAPVYNTTAPLYDYTKPPLYNSISTLYENPKFPLNDSIKSSLYEDTTPLVSPSIFDQEYPWDIYTEQTIDGSVNLSQVSLVRGNSLDCHISGWGNIEDSFGNLDFLIFDSVTV
jgi:hypothetical protein